jgi:apolipoprotein D and lipocalin family protein
VKYWLGVLGLVTLAACEPQPAFVPEGFRDTNVAITSSTRFDPKRFSGAWKVVESINPSGFPCQTAFRLNLEDDRPGYSCTFPPSPDGIDWELKYFELEVSAFGRLKYIYEQDFNDPIWVIWVDEDHRTAVLGTPSGRFGMIINRTKTLRSDRLKAAREILAFNGYDVTQLRKVSP